MLRVLFLLLIVFPLSTTAESLSRSLATADCFDSSQAYDWQYVDDYSVIARQHRRQFWIRLNGPCFALQRASSIHFEGTLNGNLCGKPGEVVRAEDQRCSILRIDPISAKQYQQLIHRQSR